ncbi:YraN family protein [Crassaminicella profunda]|uniref:YraN family protein n=1 Tax=Crassaminicella profunda TaxID=1286698 RepID=UPI001CA73032|nr:YraN family protein [Crassaminicella profunda]QZY56642.1 YraN family protein [Crassaminicella profunda]
MNSIKNLGVFGEQIAAEYLRKFQYKIVQLNYRCRFGEIDIIAYKNNTYIFVEVKTRRNLSFGRPIEAINKKKKIHLLKVGQYYMQRLKGKDYNFRFDAIEVMVDPLKPPSINHIENIIL